MRFASEKLDGKEKESEHAQRRKLDRSSYENYHTQTAKNANAGALLTGLASSHSPLPQPSGVVAIPLSMIFDELTSR